jgi:hypothetical protein
LRCQGKEKGEELRWKLREATELRSPSTLHNTGCFDSKRAKELEANADPGREKLRKCRSQNFEK